MRDGFCDWCAKCAKYLAFGTFERADENALRNKIFIFCYSFELQFTTKDSYTQ